MSGTMPMGDWENAPARETPVDADRCIYCKHHLDNWDDDVQAVPVGDDEVICSNCRDDLRRWKRSRSWLLLVHDAFEGTDAMGVFERGYEHIASSLEPIYERDVPRHPGELSNATGRKERE